MRATPLVRSVLFLSLVGLCLLSSSVEAQKSKAPANAFAGVPSQVRFSGALQDGSGSPRTGTVGILFAIYSERTGGSTLWQETQNVQLDSQGRYATLLGMGRELPKDIFTSNEARWLGVQVLADSEPEQPRVLLVSVPYALKAQDADTLGGRPASAYVLNESLNALVTDGSSAKVRTSQAAIQVDEPSGTVITTGPHTVNAIPKFSAADELANSMMTELYSQPALDAFGAPLGFSEDVVRVGDGTGLRKALHVIGGRVKAEGIDIATSLPNAVRVTNSAANGTSFQVNNTNTGTSFTTGVFTSVTSSSAVGFQSVVFAPATPSVPGADYTYAMVGANNNPEGVTVLGWHRYDAGGGDGLPSLTGPVGIFGSVAHSSGTAGIFAYRGTGTGKIFSGLAGSTEVIGMTSAGNITATGSVTAASFSGDGSALTNVTGVGSLSSDPTSCASTQFVRDIAADGTLTCVQPSSSDLSDIATLATKAYADAADASLAAPQYVTLAADGTLPNERVLTAGKGISITDGGAGSAVTIDNKVEFAQTSIQGGDAITNFPSGGAEFATSYTIPANTLTVGSVIEVWAAGMQMSSTTGNSFAYGVKIGGTTVVPGSAGIFQAATSFDLPWTLNARIICTNIVGTTATLEAQAQQTSPNGPSSFASRNNFNATTIDVASIDSALELEVFQGVISNNTDDSASMRQFIVKILK